MSDGIEFKEAPKVVKKPKKVVKKSVMKKEKKAIAQPRLRKERRTEDPDNVEQYNLDLENMDSAELNEEAVKALIRQRTGAADKLDRINKVELGLLVDRKESIDVLVSLCLSVVEVLDLVPDQLGPQIHKKTPKQIRDKLVKYMDKAKASVVHKLEELENERD